MKVDDLMLGDWILYPMRTPQKIEGITPALKENGEVIYEFFNGVEWYSLEDSNPIPLTEEILKKNGWLHDTELCAWWHENVEFMIHYIREGYMFYCSPITSIELRYVHQLQNLLRSCGEDAEMNVFI